MVVMERIVSIVHCKKKGYSQVNSSGLMVATNYFILTWMARNLWASQFERAEQTTADLCQSDECAEL